MERFMNLSIPQRTGMITEYMFKDAYSTAADRDPKRIHRLHRSVSAGQLLHDVSEVGQRLRGRGPGDKLIALIDSYATADVMFHGYWENQDMVKLEALLDRPITREQLPRSDGARWRWSEDLLRELAAQPLRASVYRDRSRNRALVVVTNFARVPVRGKVTLKLAGLDRKSLAVADVDDWPTFDGDARPAPGHAVPIRNGAIDLMIDGHDFRLVELTWP
jgi:hypothetical protein